MRKRIPAGDAIDREEMNGMFTVSIEKSGIKINASPGATLMHVLVEAGVIEVDYPCGGLGICGKCRVRIRANGGWEQVLACQTKVCSDINIEAQLDENEIYSAVCIDTAAGARANLNPAASKVFINFPGVSDKKPLCWEELRAQLGLTNQQAANIKAVRDLSHYAHLPEGFTAILYDGEIIGLEAGDTRESLYGMAFDIGTTTIVGYLFNLTAGALVATVSGLNPQVKYGADVIGRITFAEQTENGLAKLKNSITDFVNALIGEAANLSAVSRRDIYDLVFVGNPCMQHLFLQINPYSLGRAPYQPVLSQAVTFFAAGAGLDANEAAKAHWLPGVAGFVGADTVGMLLASQIDGGDKIVFAVDIGTNGEMLLWDGKTMRACSTAAGPAFEGISMTCGIRAQTGAIDKVELNGNEVSYSVIGEGLPRGICGSGFFSAIAAMLNAGLIDESGKLTEPDGDSPWKKYFSKTDNGLAFVLVPASKTLSKRDIVISQQDIRQMQLAKGAILAGFRILVKEAAISENDIQEVIIAGAFGLFLKPDEIITLALLPEVLGGKITPVGNAAGLGAQNALLSKEARKAAEEKAAKIDYIELAGRIDFTEIFIDSLSYRRC